MVILKQLFEVCKLLIFDKGFTAKKTFLAFMANQIILSPLGEERFGMVSKIKCKLWFLSIKIELQNFSFLCLNAIA